ncbi:SRPBCC family protein [Camelliibacillus cellulosilyticus]|uniref:SRPBCC family protein n=1 Tax=Camelliibacillus cellulosilyticus TaxID=2174486 RepID=A0ABV9GN65_9BACL
MDNLTKMKIFKPVADVFEAFVDPSKIGHFWFSSSSERWAKGKYITLKYDEYNAEGVIEVLEITDNQKIVFRWGQDGEGHTVTITFMETDPSSTVVEVREDGFDEKDVSQLIDNKEGWVYMLTCLKGYLEYGVNLRAALVK